jgi:hypothetical protein
MFQSFSSKKRIQISEQRQREGGRERSLTQLQAIILERKIGYIIHKHSQRITYNNF